jgi:hypothetical protein
MAGRILSKTAAALGCAAIFSMTGAAMAKSDEYVCSPMTGQLIFADGAPAAGVPVQRQWFWRGKSGSDQVSTDSEGRFAFDAVAPKRGLFGLLPAEEAVRQIFTADLPGGAFDFIDVHTSGLDRNAETKGRPFNVRCRADAEPGAADVGWGTCELIE